MKLKPSFISTSPEATKAYAARLAKMLKKGDTVLLMAGLGSGKTTFVQGLAKALKSKHVVQSPTFILAQTLKGKFPIHHLDFYRVTKKEIMDFGIEDYLTGQGEIPAGLVVIEWADRCREVWPPERLEITIKMDPYTRDRHFYLKGVGKNYLSMVKKLGSHEK